MLQTERRDDAFAMHASPAQPECSRTLQQVLDVLEIEVRLRQRLEADLRMLQRDLLHAKAELVRTHADERSAHHTAMHDRLTGLPNRASFEERSGLALIRGEPAGRQFGLMFIDLDGFKTINDVHGHRVGDELLKVVAARLERSVRVQDTISRQGGDEFLCLLLDVEDEQQVAAVANKLLEAVSAPCRLGDLTLHVRASIGIAVYPRDGSTVEQLLERADRAMYVAKRSNAGHAFFGARHVPRPLFP